MGESRASPVSGLYGRVQVPSRRGPRSVLAAPAPHGARSVSVYRPKALGIPPKKTHIFKTFPFSETHTCSAPLQEDTVIMPFSLEPINRSNAVTPPSPGASKGPPARCLPFFPSGTLCGVDLTSTRCPESDGATKRTGEAQTEAGRPPAHPAGPHQPALRPWPPARRGASWMGSKPSPLILQAPPRW